MILSGNGPLVRLAINPQNPLIMYATKTIPLGTVYKTTNGGSNWFIAGDGLMQHVYFAAGPIDINPEYPDTILLGTNAGLYRSTNAGTNWQITNIELGVGFVKYHPFLPSVCFMGIINTMKSTDFGQTWYTVDSSFSVVNLAFNHVYKHIIYSSGNYKSTDTGESWNLIDTNYSYAFSDIAINRDSLPCIFAVSSNGLFRYRDIVLGVNEVKLTDKVFRFNSYPNPFNTTTTIHFSISEQKEISIQVFDMIGGLVKTIVQSSLHNAGQYSYTWDGKNDNNIPVSSGIYFCKILINQNNSREVKSLKMILLK